MRDLQIRRKGIERKEVITSILIEERLLNDSVHHFVFIDIDKVVNLVWIRFFRQCEIRKIDTEEGNERRGEGGDVFAIDGKGAFGTENFFDSVIGLA